MQKCSYDAPNAINATTFRKTEFQYDKNGRLIRTIDPLFTYMSLEESSLNKEKASKLLEEINSTLMSISKNVVDMKDSEKEKFLDPRSSVYITINTQAKEASEKYVKLVDDYFKNWSDNWQE